MFSLNENLTIPNDLPVVVQWRSVVVVDDCRRLAYVVVAMAGR